MSTHLRLMPSTMHSTEAESARVGNARLKVLVTGGLGFVGSAVVRALNEQHPEWGVYVLDKAERATSQGNEKSTERGTINHHNDDLDLLHGCTFQSFQADITDESHVRSIFERVKPHVVVHSAGLVPDLSERYFRRLEALVKKINVNGTRNIVNVARDVGCRALVYTSSCCAVTDDLNGNFPNIDETWPVSTKSSIYGESKVEAEEIVLSANATSSTERIRPKQAAVPLGKENIDKHAFSPQHVISTCVLRPSVIFGEGDNQLIPSIHACIQKGETRYRIGHGNNMWDTVYVGNVADAHVLAIENMLFHQPSTETSQNGVNHVRGESPDKMGGTAAGQVFFIQNNEPIPFRDFSLAIWKEFGHFPPPLEIRIPEGLGWILGLIAESFTRISGQATTLSRGSVLDACAMRYASGDKARRLLGYRPRIGLEAGLKRSCQEYARRLRRRHISSSG